MVIGGDPDELGRKSELFDLADPGRTCQTPALVPQDVDGSVGAVLDAMVTLCGSWDDINTCNSYSPVTGAWQVNTNFRMYSRYNPYVQMGTNTLWVASGYYSSVYGSGTVDPGPRFPVSLQGGCAAKVNSTHLMVTGGSFAFLADLSTQQVTSLPGMRFSRVRHSCTVASDKYYVFGGHG